MSSIWDGSFRRRVRCDKRPLRILGGMVVDKINLGFLKLNSFAKVRVMRRGENAKLPSDKHLKMKRRYPW